MVVVLMAVGAVTIARAAGPALQGQVTLRPLTPSEIASYGLTGAQGASGAQENSPGAYRRVFLALLRRTGPIFATQRGRSS